MANSGQEALTVREQEILKLLLKRWSTSEIAGLVGISDRTVETHVSHISASSVSIRGRSFGETPGRIAR